VVLGAVNFANNLNFTHIRNRGNDNNGTYETPNFASASHKIVIDYNGGVGNFSIPQLGSNIWGEGSFAPDFHMLAFSLVLISTILPVAPDLMASITSP